MMDKFRACEYLPGQWALWAWNGTGYTIVPKTQGVSEASAEVAAAWLNLNEQGLSRDAWIDPGRSLPEESGDYLAVTEVATPNGRIRPVYFNGENWTHCHECGFDIKVLYWQPLPEPPEQACECNHGRFSLTDYRFCPYCAEELDCYD